MTSAYTTSTTAANGAPLPPLPKDHLDHPENWATGGEPATNSQKGFIKVLEGKKPELVPEGGVQLEGLSKSEGSEVIEKLKSGEKVEQNTDKKEDAEQEKEGKGDTGAAATEPADSTARSSRLQEPVPTKSNESPSNSSSSKRKTTSDATTAPSISSAEAASTDADKTDDTMQVDSETPSAAEPAQKQEASNGKTEEAATAETETDRPAKKAKTDTEFTESKKGETNGNGNGNGHATSSPPADDVVTPPAAPVDPAAEAEMKEAEKAEETVPGEGHLEHPENWATGDEPATDKQKGFIKVLEKQKGAAAATAVGDVENLGKSEASEKIDELKSM